MFRELQEQERVDLTRLASIWARALGEKKGVQLFKQIAACFEDWKLSKADANGMLQVSSVGLLSTGETLLPAANVKAWQCGDILTNDYVSLAFELWLSGHAGFADIIDRFGLPEVFSVLTLFVRDDTSLASLIRVNGMLAGLLEGQMQFIKEDSAHWRRQAEAIAKVAHVRSKGLTKGPPAASIARRKKAANRYSMLATRFGDLFRGDKPSRLKDAARFIENETADVADPLHGKYTFQTLRDDILPTLRDEIRAEQRYSKKADQ